MPQAKRPNNFAALTFELVPGADGVTTEAHLLPPGPFRSTDVRPVECAAWQLDAGIAARVISRLAAQKNDTLIDYEHQSLRSKDNGQKVVAAGWIPNKLEWREGKGLYATDIGWTGEAKRMIAAKEIRYVSTVFYYAAATGEVLEIISVALTNTPAIDGLDEIAQAAMTRGALSVLSTTEGADMALTEQQIAALTADRDAANQKLAALTTENATVKTQLAALTTERDSLKTKVDAIESEKAAAALVTEKAKHGELLQAALTDGRLVPAQKVWAEKQSFAALTEYLDATKPLAMLNKQTDGKEAAGNHGLSDVELAACTKMGVTPEEFAKSTAKK
jgi:phage I-like protein